MIRVIGSREAAAHARELSSMHHLRARVFGGRLGWDVTITEAGEVDRYDALGPVHLVHIGCDGEVDGCARLLPATGPTMLRDTFPVLLGGRPLRTAGVWESSRFAVDTARAGCGDARGLARVTFELIAAEYEHALANGIGEIVTVTDVRMERILVRAGCAWERIAEPQTIGVTRAVAGYIAMTEEGLARVRTLGGLDGPVLEPAAAAKVAA
ncbi:MAG TPA: acyl-homoserine-lactone synthase [Caulobacteraceae bacterium]|jgi:acyl homoserine lactone synthase